jgi:hypothetical protein
VPRLSVASAEDKLYTRLSTDGAWVMYFAFPGGYSPAKSLKLMRAPISGGSSEFVGGVRAGANFSLCASAGDGVRPERVVQLAFYALDPMRGRGPELLRIDVKPLADDCD